MMQRTLALAAGMVLLATAAAAPSLAAAPAARTFVVGADRHTNTEAVFTSRASMVRFQGRTSEVSGEAVIPMADIAKASGKVVVALGKLDTGIALRNEHMMGALEAAKHPTTSFAFTSLRPAGGVKTLAPGKETKAVAVGSFTLHGVTKPMSAPITLTYLPQTDANYRPGDWVEFTAKFPVHMPTHGIQLPAGVFGVKVAETVEIEITGMAKAK